MKKTLLVLIAAMLLSSSIMAQQSASRQKPAWTNGYFKELKSSTVKQFEETGRTEEEARNKALLRVIEWQTGATGLRAQVQIQNERMVVSGDDNLTVKARIIDEFRERTKAGDYRAYLLVQITQNPAYEFDNLEQVLKDIRKQLGRSNSAFFSKKHNNYLAWTTIEIGYPFNVGTGFAGRHGGIIGIGYYLDAGAAFSGDIDIIPFHYAGGLKFFPYKNIFLSAGYGTLGCEKVSLFNDSEGRWGTDGYRQGKGLLFTAGYDVLSNLAGGDGSILSVGAGVSYDLFLETWRPVISIKFGWAFAL